MTKIFAYLPARALGDFTAYAILASSIAEMFDDSELYVFYRVDRPYKDPIASYLRNARDIITIPQGQPSSIPLEFFDGHAQRMRLKDDSPLETLGLWNSDIVLAGNMFNTAALHGIPTTTLRPPPQAVRAGDAKLFELGLNPAKWVACVYWKETGYEYRGFHPVRSIFDAAPYIEIIRHITQDLGGQVVRLGHPTEIELPRFKGFLDLAKMSNSEWLQLYAVSISRFFIGSGSGPTAYGPALGVPTAVTDQNICFGVWNPHDYIVTQKILYRGKLLSQLEAYEAGILFIDWEPSEPVNYIRNTAEELIAATDEMYRTTTNCTAWRPPAEWTPRLPRPNSFSLPLPKRYAPELLIPPTQRTAAVVGNAAPT